MITCSNCKNTWDESKDTKSNQFCGKCGAPIPGSPHFRRQVQDPRNQRPL